MADLLVGEDRPNSLQLGTQAVDRAYLGDTLVWPPAFDPLTALSWHAVFWADDPAWTPPADGGAVSSWRDGSGNGRNATQGTGTNQPAYRASEAALNGHAAVDFGNDDVLDTATWTGLDQWSLFMVAKYDGTAGRFFLGYSTSTAFASIRQVGSDLRLRNPNTSPAVTYTQNTTNPFLIWGTLRRTSPYTMRIGVNDATATDTTGIVLVACDFLRIGGRPNATIDLTIDARIGIVGLYPGDITTDPAWISLKSWATDYYAITTADPAGSGSFRYPSTID